MYLNDLDDKLFWYLYVLFTIILILKIYTVSFKIYILYGLKNRANIYLCVVKTYFLTRISSGSDLKWNLDSKNSFYKVSINKSTKEKVLVQIIKKGLIF